MNKVSRMVLVCGVFFLATITVKGQEIINNRQMKLDTLKKAKVGSRLDIPKDAIGRKRFERDHFRRTLGIDSAKAEKLLKIQSDYKSALVKVAADSSLNDTGKRAAIDRLMDVKNVQLESLLTPAQQSKIIPTTERRGKPSTRP